MSKKRGRFVTLLELLLVVCLLTSVGGMVFYRADQFLRQHRFQKDAAQLSHLLCDTRRLAFYTKADWHVQLEKKKAGWNVSFHCHEELTASKGLMKMIHLSPVELRLNEKLVEKLTIEMSSTGHVYPKGVLKIVSPNGKISQSINLPTIFYQRGVLSEGPAHPKELLL